VRSVYSECTITSHYMQWPVDLEFNCRLDTDRQEHPRECPRPIAALWQGINVAKLHADLDLGVSSRETKLVHSLRHMQPVKIAKEWRNVIEVPRSTDQPGSSAEHRLQCTHTTKCKKCPKFLFAKKCLFPPESTTVQMPFTVNISWCTFESVSNVQRSITNGHHYHITLTKI